MLAIRICLILLISCLLFFWLNIPYTHLRSVHHAWNLGHVAFFWIATYLLLKQLYADRKVPLQHAVLVLVGALLIGGLIELIQTFIAREASILDISYDLVGTLTALAIQGIQPKAGQNILRLFAGSTLAIACWPTLTSLIDEAIARHQFPVLANFETPFEKSRFGGDAQFVQADKQLRVTFQGKAFSSLELNFFPPDWRNYEKLMIFLDNPGTDKVNLICRINDTHHNRSFEYSDRYTRQFNIEPGRQTLVIPLEDVRQAPKTREMDMHDITLLICSTYQQIKPHIIVFESLRLE